MASSKPPKPPAKPILTAPQTKQGEAPVKPVIFTDFASI